MCCDIKEPTTIYWLRDYLPLYPSVSCRTLSRHLGVKINPLTLPRIGTPDGVILDARLNLPRNPIGFGGPPRRPNILLIFADSARADVLRPDVMPDVWKWKDDALWLTNHFSTGHSTREGMFGALYGLPASYLIYACEEKGQPP